MLDTLLEFGIFCLEFFFWWMVIDFVITLWQLLSNRHTLTDEERKEIREQVQTMLHRVEVEKHGDIHYWYDSRDGQFLAQGRTLEEMIDHVRDRFPSHIFFVDSKQTVYKLCGPDWKFEPVAEKDID